MSSWIVEPIGELFDIGAGKSVTPSARVGDRPYPFLRTANVFWGRIDVSRVDAMHFSDVEIAQKSLRPGDLLVCEGGDIGRAAIWRGELADCGFQNHLHRLRAKSARISPLFAMFYLEAGFTQLGIFEGAGNKTTIPNLSRNRLAALEIPVPVIGEQRRIAAILWKIQRSIDVQEQLVATVRELKQAAMRQLFTRGLRGEAQKETEIGMVPESWEVVPFETLREFLQYGTSSKCDYPRVGNPVLRIPNVIGGKVDATDLKWCELSEKEVAQWLLADGDILFVRTNGVRDRVGTCAAFHGEPANALFASYLIRARLLRDRLDPDYLQYFVGTSAGIAQLGGRASPAADGKFNVNTKTIDAVLVPVPATLAEQHEIATALQTIDRKLAYHERKRDTLQELFKTLLHELMTGRIRVHELDIDITALAGGPTGGEDS